PSLRFYSLSCTSLAVVHHYLHSFPTRRSSDLLKSSLLLSKYFLINFFIPINPSTKEQDRLLLLSHIEQNVYMIQETFSCHISKSHLDHLLQTLQDIRKWS